MAKVMHKSSKNRLLSGGVWQKVPYRAWGSGIEGAGKEGIFLLDDLSPYVSGNFTEVEGDTNMTSAAKADITNGEVELTGAHAASTDNQEVYIGSTDIGGGGFKLTAGKIAAAEIRFKVSTITGDNISLFAGFIETAYTIAANMLTDADALVAQDGFGCYLDGSSSKTALDIIYGPSLAAPVTHKAGAHTLVADTYLNFGAYCDGTNVEFFIDSVKIGDSVALASVAADGVVLRPAIGFKRQGDSATAITVTLDSIATAMEL
jgi:hypothetical protein